MTDPREPYRPVGENPDPGDHPPGPAEAPPGDGNPDPGDASPGQADPADHDAAPDGTMPLRHVEDLNPAHDASAAPDD